MLSKTHKETVLNFRADTDIAKCDPLLVNAHN